MVLIVTHPLVNILRGAMSILVSVVSHPHSSDSSSQSGPFGFQALKPVIAVHEQFLEMLVSRLSSADHALCANALQLINSLMRDAITSESEAEWPKFIQRLQDLGVIRAVYVLMQGSALQDLAHPLLEFQTLSKVLLQKWRDVRVDLEKPDHRRTLKGIHLASNSERAEAEIENGSEPNRSKRHNPHKWRRLGFETESPQSEFQEMGYLGMMDLTDYVRKYQDEFQKTLLEQSTRPTEQRCPIARASLAITSVLYEHFEVDKTDGDDSKSYLVMESRTNFDKLFRPLLLHWSRLHVAGLRTFFRLWKSTGAELEDCSRIVELVRILIESVVGAASRTKDIQEVEDEMADFEYQRLRDLQMELLELTYEDAWGTHLVQVRDELHNEALQFVKEQRIRCLLQGAWFPIETNSAGEPGKKDGQTCHRYVQLSHNRRYLHWADMESMDQEPPDLDGLPHKSKLKSQDILHLFTRSYALTCFLIVDLNVVSSVVSNVSASSDSSSGSTIKTLQHQSSSSSTRITIHGYANPSSNRPHTSSSKISASRSRSNSKPNTTTTGAHNNNNNTEASTTTDENEIVLLTLQPQSHSIASEWLDALLMLLNQQPITAETNKMINLVSNYGLKIRLLNVRFDDATFAGECPEIPSRIGLDDDYYYDIYGVA